MRFALKTLGRPRGYIEDIMSRDEPPPVPTPIGQPDLSRFTDEQVAAWDRLCDILHGTQEAGATRSLLAFTLWTKPDYRPGRPHRLLAQHLDQLLAGRFKRLMVFLPPRHGKSELVSRRLPAYFLGLYPDKQVIACSYSASLANRMNRDCQRMIDSPAYQELFPNVKLAAPARRGRPPAVRTQDLFEIDGRELDRFTGLDDNEGDQVDVTAYAVWQMPRMLGDAAATDAAAERRRVEFRGFQRRRQRLVGTPWTINRRCALIMTLPTKVARRLTLRVGRGKFKPARLGESGYEPVQAARLCRDDRPYRTIHLKYDSKVIVPPRSSVVVVVRRSTA